MTATNSSSDTGAILRLNNLLRRGWKGVLCIEATGVDFFGDRVWLYGIQMVDAKEQYAYHDFERSFDLSTSSSVITEDIVFRERERASSTLSVKVGFTRYFVHEGSPVNGDRFARVSYFSCAAFPDLRYIPAYVIEASPNGCWGAYQSFLEHVLSYPCLHGTLLGRVVMRCLSFPRYVLSLQTRRCWIPLCRCCGRIPESPLCVGGILAAERLLL